MSRSCPHCQTDVEYQSHRALVLEGTCSGCGQVLTVLQGLPETAGTEPEMAAGAPSGGDVGSVAAAWTGPVPECEECGAPLTFRSSGEGIQAVCSSCHAESVFVPVGSAPPPEAEARRPAPRFEGRGERRERPAPGFDGPRAARPCRECGGPLQFNTAPDGTISGECSSCGNRFTLPPRREGFRSDRPGGGGRFGRPPGRGGFERRGPPGGGRFGDRRGGGGGFRPRERRDDDGGGADDRRRRRPRRE